LTDKQCRVLFTKSAKFITCRAKAIV